VSVLCVLSGRGLCDELITRAEESSRLWRVVCHLETSWMRSPRPTGGCRAKNKQTFSFYEVNTGFQSCFSGMIIRSVVLNINAPSFCETFKIRCKHVAAVSGCVYPIGCVKLTK